MEITIFTERLRERRNFLRLTQEELAARALIARNTIARYERGELAPKYRALQKLATALNTTTSYLLGETDDPEPRPTVTRVDASGGNVGNVGGVNNVGNVTVNATTGTKQEMSVPLWVTLPQAVYHVVQNGTPQEIDAALDAMRSGVKVLEQAKVATA